MELARLMSEQRSKIYSDDSMGRRLCLQWGSSIPWSKMCPQIRDKYISLAVQLNNTKQP